MKLFELEFRGTVQSDRYGTKTSDTVVRVVAPDAAEAIRAGAKVAKDYGYHTVELTSMKTVYNSVHIAKEIQ